MRNATVRARRWVAALALGVIAWIGASSAAGAEPRFAVREGMRCRDCHVNRTGGGMRTPFGVSFSQTNLASHRLPGAWDPVAGGSVSFGGNLRLASRTRFPASTSLAGVDRSTDATSSFEITEGNLYVRAAAIPDRVTFYLDETVTPESASSREAFVLVEGLPLDGYVKAGRFLLPYGLRIPDDFAFMRQETGFTYANADLGVEVGIDVHPFAVSVAVTNGSLGGSDPNLAKQVTAQAIYTSSRARVGLSFAWNDTSEDGFEFYSLTAGAHAGVRLGRLVVLADVDWIRGVTTPDSYDQAALYTELNFEAVRGVYGRFVFEAFDPLWSLDENERDRFVLGVSWFPVQLVETRVEYRLNRDIPQRVEGNADELIVEVHSFL